MTFNNRYVFHKVSFTRLLWQQLLTWLLKVDTAWLIIKRQKYMYVNVRHKHVWLNSLNASGRTYDHWNTGIYSLIPCIIREQGCACFDSNLYATMHILFGMEFRIFRFWCPKYQVELDHCFLLSYLFITWKFYFVCF